MSDKELSVKNMQPENTIYPVKLADIRLSDENVRLSDPIKDLDELAASIERHGLLQPVVLMGKWGHPPYDLISGQRRFLAHEKVLKRKEIPAVFVPRMDKAQATVRSLVENMQRLELEYEDTARAVTYLYTQFGRDERKVQKETGLSLRKIRDLILVQERATEKMKRWIKEGKLSSVDAKRVIRAAQDDLNKAEMMAELIIKHKPTSHQKRRLVAYGERDKKATAEAILSKAMKPHVEQNMVIVLPDDVREGFQKATEAMAMEPEELATKVLGDWLRGQGFVS